MNWMLRRSSEKFQAIGLFNALMGNGINCRALILPFVNHCARRHLVSDFHRKSSLLRERIFLPGKLSCSVRTDSCPAGLPLYQAGVRQQGYATAPSCQAVDYSKEEMERAKGFEPSTFTLAR